MNDEFDLDEEKFEKSPMDEGWGEEEEEEEETDDVVPPVIEEDEEF
jgi:hypothetical protein